MIPEPLVLIGAGGFARETAAAVSAINSIEPRWDLKGHVDDDERRHGDLVGGLPILGPTLLAATMSDAKVVVCTGNPRDFGSRRRIVERLRLDADRYATLVHPAASIAWDTRIGAGTVVLAATVTTAAVSIGAHVAIMPSCVLTHDDVVDDFATLGAAVRLSGGVHVGAGAYVGAGTLVREGADLGARCLVGMGAVVLRSVPPDEVWIGAPAHHLRPVVDVRDSATTPTVTTP